MDERKLRAQLVYSLGGKGAHVSFDKAVKGFPRELAGKKVAHLAHTAWQQVYHLWIAQWDILEFSRDPDHKSPKFPDGYWPARPEPPDEKAWDRSVNGFCQDLNSMCALVADDATDLYARIPHGDGQTILREALLTADHNAYHLGQLVLLRRQLGAWTVSS